MKKEKLTALLGPMSLGCSWFGAQMGATTASGAGMMNFAVRFGWPSVFTMLLSILWEAWFVYWILELCRISKIHHYQDFLTEVFYPIDKVMIPLIDILLLCVYPVFIASCTAGIAELAVTYLDLNYNIALCITMVIFTLLAVFGAKAMRSMASILTVFIVVILLCVLAICLPDSIPGVIEVLKHRTMGADSVSSSIAWTFMLLAMKCSTQTAASASNMVATSQGVLNSKRDSIITVLTGSVCLTIALEGICLTLLGRWPGNVGSAIPLLEAVQASGVPALELFYPLFLLAAFITTGPTYIFTQSDRWSHAGFWKKLNLKQNSLFSKERPRVILVSIIYVLLSYAFSTFGFEFINRVLIVNQAYIWMPTLLFPFTVIVPLRTRKLRRELEETGKVTTKSSIRHAEKISSASS